MRVAPTPAFERQYRKLSRDRRAAVDRALVRFMADPADARLWLHKLGGALADRWAISAGYDLRIVCRIEGQRARLLAVGSHDEVY